MVVELEQFRRFNHRTDGLDAGGRKRGNAEPGVELFCGGTDCCFSLVMEQSLQGGWRQEQRQVDTFTHDHGRHVDRLDAREDARDEIAFLVRLGVAPIRDLIVRGTIDIVEDRARQPAPGETTELLGVVALIQVHERTRLDCRGSIVAPEKRRVTRDNDLRRGLRPELASQWTQQKKRPPGPLLWYLALPRGFEPLLPP